MHQRWKTPFAEVDLVLQGPSPQLILAEVKGRTHREFWSVAFTRKQKKRLQRVAMWLSEQGFLVEVCLAFVDAHGQVEIYSDPLV